MNKLISDTKILPPFKGTTQEKLKQIAMLKKTIAQSQLALDQVRKAVSDVELRLTLMNVQKLRQRNKGRDSQPI